MKISDLSKYIFLFLAVLGLAGCKEDFLERPPLSQLTDGTYYTTGEEVLQATAPLYNVVWFDFNDKSSFGIGDARAGNMISNDYNSFYQFSVAASNDRLIESWRSFYNVIGQSNMVMYNIDKSTKTTVPDNMKRHAIAEARFMRGVAYSYLVRNWGAVPIIDNNVKQMGDTSIARNTVESVWEFAIRDLRYAVKNLPAVSVAKGRINKYSAEGMLSRLFLVRSGVGATGGKRNQTDLDSAKYYAQDVIKNSPFSLMSSYPDLFMTKNNNNPESMFALQWVYNGEWGTQNTFQAYMAYDTKVTGSWDGWGAAHGASADYLKSVSPADSIRRKATFMLYGDLYKEILQKNGGLLYDRNTVANIKKYVVGTADDNDGKVTGMHTEVNTNMLRLAEVYLNYAESILGDKASTSEPEALKYFNMVRTRAGMPALSVITFDDIFKERRVEFAMEGNYWYELVRLYYFNPAKAKEIINGQDKGSYTVAIKPGTGTSASNPRQFVFTFTPVYYKVDDSTFWLPYPESELAKAPNLRKPPVPYKF